MIKRLFYRPLGSLKWTTINPEELVQLMQSSYGDDQLPFNLAELSGLLKEVGVRKSNSFCLVQ